MVCGLEAADPQTCGSEVSVIVWKRTSLVQRAYMAFRHAVHRDRSVWGSDRRRFVVLTDGRPPAETRVRRRPRCSSGVKAKLSETKAARGKIPQAAVRS
jgi:hypothetical protein